MATRNLVAERINDPFDSFDEDEWLLGGDAIFRLSRIRLTSSTDNTTGYLEWRDSFTRDVWEVRFEFDIENGDPNPADETAFSWYAESVSSDGWTPDGGYQVSYDHSDDTIRLDSYVDGEQKTLDSSNVVVPDDDVKNAGRVIYTRGKVVVLMNGDRYIEHEIRDPVISGDKIFFSSRTTSNNTEHYIDDVRLIAATDRNIKTVQSEWPSSAVDIGNQSNTYKLMRALVSSIDEEDKFIDQIKRAHHIDTATDEELEKFGQLVQLDRKSNESDDKYRARLKVQYRVGNISTTFDQFAEFSASLLETDIENVEFTSDLAADPATAVVAAEPNVYDSINITTSEVIDFLGEAVPAGHEVKVLERGTFRLKSDGDVDDPDKGLTSDGITTGGTLAADLT